MSASGAIIPCSPTADGFVKFEAHAKAHSQKRVSIYPQRGGATAPVIVEEPTATVA